MKFRIGDRVRFKTNPAQFGKIVDIRRNQHERLMWCYIIQFWRRREDGTIEFEDRIIDLSADFVDEFYNHYFGNGVEEMLLLLEDEKD